MKNLKLQYASRLFGELFQFRDQNNLFTVNLSLYIKKQFGEQRVNK